MDSKKERKKNKKNKEKNVELNKEVNIYSTYQFSCHLKKYSKTNI